MYWEKDDFVVAGKKYKEKFPRVCVEVKTYLDATMYHEALFSGTQIKTASPDCKTYILMEHNEVGADASIPSAYYYAINKQFILRNGSRKDAVKQPIKGSTLLDYYIEVEKNL